MKTVETSWAFEDEVNGAQLLKKIEIAGRTCYKTEFKITEDSYLKFANMICNVYKHHSVLEHASVTVRIICDRGISHEIVRHRIGAYSQECLVGSTIIKKNTNGKDITIKYLHERQKYEKYNGKINNKIFIIKSMTDDIKIIKNTIKYIFNKGVQPVYKVKTNNGYEIICTMGHKFYSNSKFIRLENLKINDKIAVTGLPKLSKNPNGWHVGNHVHQDTICSIEYVGEEETYDLEMENPYNNYVANGFIVHNSTRYCSYNKHKFGNQITVIKPEHLKTKEVSDTIAWQEAIEESERHYFKLLKKGWSAQEARGVLPTELKTEIIVTYNLRQWRHFFEMRCDKAAHPQLRALTIPMLKGFKEKIPVIFDDLEF